MNSPSGTYSYFADAPPDVAIMLSCNNSMASLADFLFSGVLVGLWPAWRAANFDNLSARLHAGGTRGGSEGPASGRAQSLLVIGQVALALILLTGAGLLIRSFQRAQSVPQARIDHLKAQDKPVLVAEVGHDADRRNYEVSYEKIREKGFETTVDLDRGIAELVRRAAQTTNDPLLNVPAQMQQ